MANGYWNRVLHVDLSTGETWIENPPDEMYRSLLGGRGFVGHYLLKEVPRGIDAFDPENRLVFAAGVATGAPFPGAGRHSVGAKSPANGAYGEAESGGFWGAELKKAGWDGIVVSGRAARPTYLWIDDERVELKDASHLWGKLTAEVEDTIREELGDRLIRVAQTGIAGERLGRFACIVNDLNEVAGRTGLGAVMGSKNLKAIAVRGKRQVPLANPTYIREVARWVASTMEENHKNFHELGTGASMMGKQLEGHLIVRNFRDGQWEGHSKIDAVAIRDTYRVKMDGCFACSVRCKKRVRLEEPFKVDPKFGGPEYETIGAMGTNLAMDNLAALCRASQLANELGIDSISTGGAIAWATECFELGLITEADTGGIRLEWGNGELLVKLVEMIGRREGFGDLLAEGALRAARKIGRGTEKYVVHVKGLEVAMHDPRGVEALKVNYPVTPTGGDHTQAGLPRTSLRNMVGVCQFLKYDEPRMAEIINAVTGWDVTEDELKAIVKRGLTLARLFNLREGITRADDRLPWRLHQPFTYGPMSGAYRLPEEDIAKRVSDYYAENGWDDAGVPRAETLSALGLAAYAS